jgi:hypothetical protein
MNRLIIFLVSICFLLVLYSLKVTFGLAGVNEKELEEQQPLPEEALRGNTGKLLDAKAGQKDNALSDKLTSELVREREQLKAKYKPIDFNLQDSPPWAVFYNVYAAEKENDKKHAIWIMKEQLRQLSNSYANQKEQKLSVFVNTIGSPVQLNETCPDSLNCIHMDHYTQAFEEVTLHRVHEYCVANPDKKVIYIHSKGSYNARSGNNDYWRRHMTMIVSRQECLEPPNDIQCDVCGLYFAPVPWFHYPGNMFSAKCSYVKNLLPIEEFRIRINDMAEKLRRHKNESLILFNMWDDIDAYLGLDRYSSEHWVGSHPSMVACDMSKVRKAAFWMKQRDVEKNVELSLAPRANEYVLKYGIEYYRNFTEAKGILTGLEQYPECYQFDDSFRMREYYLLAGHMHNWIQLYNTTPGNSSWIWEYFPDGKVWRNGAHKYGSNVIEAMLAPYMNFNKEPSLRCRNRRTRHRKMHLGPKRREPPLTPEEISSIWLTEENENGEKD